MNIGASAITAIVTLLGVTLGGWLSLRGQERSWRRDHARQWRDIRLAAYGDFLSAYRQFIAFTLEPTANITIAPHPRKTGESMPFFDETGRPYRENLESAMMAIRLVSDLPETVVAHRNLVTLARRVASARGTSTEREIPSELFVDLWKAEQEFVTAARREMDLPDIYTPT